LILAHSQVILGFQDIRLAQILTHYQPFFKHKIGSISYFEFSDSWLTILQF